MPWAAAVAVGLAMVAMHLTRTFHPPAGIDPLVVVRQRHVTGSFLLAPVAVGALLLGAFAFALAQSGVQRGPGNRWW